MKRFVITSTLALTTATAAVAATEGQINTIENYIPEANVEAWSDTQVLSALSVINSGDKSRGEIVNTLKGMYIVDDSNFTPAMITSGEAATLDRYVDGVDYSTLPQPIVDSALNIAAAGDMNDDEKSDEIEQLLTDMSAPATLNTATSGELALIESYVPEVNADALTEAQVLGALNIISSTDKQGEVKPKLKAYLNAS